MKKFFILFGLICAYNMQAMIFIPPINKDNFGETEHLHVSSGKMIKITQYPEKLTLLFKDNQQIWGLYLMENYHEHSLTLERICNCKRIMIKSKKMIWGRYSHKKPTMYNRLRTSPETASLLKAILNDYHKAIAPTEKKYFATFLENQICLIK